MIFLMTNTIRLNLPNGLKIITEEVFPTIEGEYPTGRAGFIRRGRVAVDALPHVKEDRKKF